MVKGQLSILALLSLWEDTGQVLEKTHTWYDRIMGHFQEMEWKAEFIYK